MRARSPEKEQRGLRLSDLPGKWGTAPTQVGVVTLNELDAPVQGCPYIFSTAMSHSHSCPVKVCLLF